MYKHLLGESHPAVASSLNNLAALLAATDRPVEAYKLMINATKIDDRRINSVFASSSDQDRLSYLKTIRGNFDIFLSLIYTYFPQSAKAKKIALDLVLKRKALTATALAIQNQAIYSGRYPHLQEKFQKWRSNWQQLSNLHHTSPTPAQSENHQKLIQQLENECNQIEQELAREIPEMQLQQQLGDRRAVALELPPGATLIEFVRFDVANFKAVKAQGENQWQAARYLAFILPAGQPEQVEMIDLGEAENIDRLIRILRESIDNLTEGNNLDWDVTTEKNSPPTPVKKVPENSPSSEVRQAVFDKLIPYLGTNKHLIFAPDGMLNLLPFKILPNASGEKRLIDDYTISYLSVGRDILRYKIKTNRSANKALVIGNPTFNLPQNPENSTNKTPKTVAEAISIMSGNLGFTPAETTEFIAKTVAEKLGVKPYLKEEALASHLLTCQSPEVLLVATHGFFRAKINYIQLINKLLSYLNNPKQVTKILTNHRNLLDEILLQNIEDLVHICAENNDQEIQEIASFLKQIIPQIQKIINTSKVNTLNTKVENAMLRSGLAFAGANNWLNTNKLSTQEEKREDKGLVFAQDIAGLDLWENELSILIACQTGVGELITGEGVFGLRRAFVVAGSKSLIMSLWSVPEKASILLMNRFFDNLNAGLGRVIALQSAQDYIRKITIKELRNSETGKAALKELEELQKINENYPEDYTPFAHPYFWGAWICQGDTDNFKVGK